MDLGRCFSISLNTLIKLACVYFFFIFLDAAWPPPHEKGLIIDTDFFGDVNDAGALLLACTHPESHLLAVNLNYPSVFSASAVVNILGYYDHHKIPVGVRKPFNNNTYVDMHTFKKGEFASKVAHHWRTFNFDHRDIRDHGATWDPVKLYRHVLARSKAGAVTVVSLGFLDNLSGLLDSPADNRSMLSGRDLVKEKVKELVILGGQYPHGREANFGYNVTATMNVIDNWPGKMVFSGYELGREVITGARFVDEANAYDPVRSAYQWYNGHNNSRGSWDPLTMLYAIEGLGDTFKLAEHDGHNVIFPNGRNVWMYGEPKFEQAYLRLNVSNETAAARLEDLLIHGAANFSKSSLHQDLVKLHYMALKR